MVREVVRVLVLASRCYAAGSEHMSERIGVYYSSAGEMMKGGITETALVSTRLTIPLNTSQQTVQCSTFAVLCTFYYYVDMYEYEYGQGGQSSRAKKRTDRCHCHLCYPHPCLRCVSER